MPSAPCFSPQLFSFLRDLRRNNRREWFSANRARYDDWVLDPALRFISDMGAPLRKISTHFLAVPKASGGSLFRIHRDVRFGRDKSPYKTHVGIHFRHENHKDAHAPGFYLHLDPGEVFVAAGVWRPDASALRSIRTQLVARPAAWRRATSGRGFEARFRVGGDQVKRPPRGVDPDHPLIEDLKRTSFIAITELDQAAATRPGFRETIDRHFRAGAPLVEFLCRSLGVAF